MTRAANYLRYDSEPITDLAPTFSRALATVNSHGGDGRPVGANERRYGPMHAHCPVREWTEVDQTLFSSNGEIYATGWASDNVTPLLIVQDSTTTTLKLYSGASYTLIDTLDYSSGLLGGDEYLAFDAEIYHGLILLSCSRASGASVVGVSWLWDVDSLSGLTAIDFAVNSEAAGADAGMLRGQQRTTAAYPKSKVGDLRGCVVAGADYLRKPSQSPKGGQVFAAVFYRTGDIATDWSEDGSQVVFDRWESGDSGALHGHSAWYTEGGIGSTWGDVNHRNDLWLHALDIDNLGSETPTNTVTFGGFSTDETKRYPSPQFTNCVPGPRLYECLGSTDLTRSAVVHVRNQKQASDGVRFDEVIWRQRREGSGTGTETNVPEHISNMTGKGWVSGGQAQNLFHYTIDGEHWGQINPDPISVSRMYVYGDKLIQLSTNNKILETDLPTPTLHRPLAIAPGGFNEMSTDGTLFEDSAPASGNVFEQVYYDRSDALWRKSSDDSILDRQPEGPPPFDTDNAFVYRVYCGSTSDRSLGIQYTSKSGENATTPNRFVLDQWLCILSDQGAEYQRRQRINATQTDPYSAEVHTPRRWKSNAKRELLSSGGPSRLRTTMYGANSSGDEAEGSEFLLAWVFHGAANDTPYQIPPRVTGPDEIEAVDGLTLGTSGNWSVAIATTIAEHACYDSVEKPLFTLKADDDNHVEVLLDLVDTETANLVVRVTNDSSVDHTITASLNDVSTSDSVDLALSFDGTDLAVSARVGVTDYLVDSVAATIDQELTRLVLANAAEDTVATQWVSGVWIDDTAAWSAAERLEFLTTDLISRWDDPNMPTTAQILDAIKADMAISGTIEVVPRKVGSDASYTVSALVGGVAVDFTAGSINVSDLEDDSVPLVASYNASWSGLTERKQHTVTNTSGAALLAKAIAADVSITTVDYGVITGRVSFGQGEALGTTGLQESLDGLVPTQTRINQRFGPGVSTVTSSRNDNTLPAAKRLKIGTSNLPAHLCDMSPIHGKGINVQTVGTPVVTPSGELTATALGPRDEAACVQLAGTPTVGSSYRVDVPVTMETGATDVASWYVDCLDKASP